MRRAGDEALEPVGEAGMAQRVADASGISIQTLIMAHLLLDENLDAIANGSADPAQKSLLELAEKHRGSFPASFKDGAALGLLLTGIPE